MLGSSPDPIQPSHKFLCCQNKEAKPQQPNRFVIWNNQGGLCGSSGQSSTDGWFIYLFNLPPAFLPKGDPKASLTVLLSSVLYISFSWATKLNAALQKKSLYSLWSHLKSSATLGRSDMQSWTHLACSLRLPKFSSSIAVSHSPFGWFTHGIILF